MLRLNLLVCTATFGFQLGALYPWLGDISKQNNILIEQNNKILQNLSKKN